MRERERERKRNEVMYLEPLALLCFLKFKKSQCLYAINLKTRIYLGGGYCIYKATGFVHPTSQSKEGHLSNKFINCIWFTVSTKMI